MEVISNGVEVNKCFKIDNFPQYSETSDVICGDFDVDVENFRSHWNLSLYPMHSSNVNDNAPVNCDVFAELECLFSTVPSNYLQEIEIYSVIKGRENYPELIIAEEYNKKNCTWKCTLISRVTLASLKLVTNGVFEFYFKFLIPKSILQKSVDGKVNVVKDIGNILIEPHYFDICLVSNSDVKFFVHSVMLHNRCNVIKNGKSEMMRLSRLLNEDLPPGNAKIESDHGCSSTIKVEISDNFSSDFLSPVKSHNKSPWKDRTKICKKTPIFSPSQKALKRTYSPVNQSPKRSAKGMSVTPKKVNTPLKAMSQTQLTSFFSPLKSESHKENIRNAGGASRALFWNSNSPKPCQVIPFQNCQNVLSSTRLNEEERTIKLITMKMSTSVLQEFLCWLYTGESSRLKELSQPLLVAGIRHEVKDLALAAQYELISTLTTSNVVDMLRLSYKYNANVLLENSMEFAVANACTITSTESWNDLAKTHSELLLEFTRRLATQKSN